MNRRNDLTIGVIGFGSQGAAQAQNLRDSGFSVRVGLPRASATRERAAELGFEVGTAAEAAAGSDVVAVLVPDTAAPALYENELAHALEPGACLLFAHGFSIHYHRIVPAPTMDVVMVAPKAPGHDVRELFADGHGAPALIAIHRDATGRARELAEAYAEGIGAYRTGVVDTTFAEETETDLFGEQAVLVGGVIDLSVAAYETLVEAGYAPEAAYFECIHELKMCVDLMYHHGPAGMFPFCSATARYGGLTRGPRVIGPQVRDRMRELLGEIRDGSFAREWIAESGAGAPNLARLLDQRRSHPVEATGARLREIALRRHSADAIADAGEGARP